MLNSMNNPLKVALMSISSHNRAILEFFFAGAGKQIFTPVNAEQAEALIIDFDHPGGKQEWQDQNAIGVKKPAIVISVKETAEENIVWVPKPLTSQTLAGAAEKIRALMPQDAADTPAQADTVQVESEESIASLRALLDKQANDLRPFGVSGKQNFKAPPAVPAPSSRVREEALVKTADVQPAQPVMEGAAEVPEEDSYLRTEDVYVPPPLAEDEMPESDSTFQLDSVDETDDPIKLEQRWNQLCGRENTVSRENWHDSNALYTPENYFLNSLIDALKLAHQSKQYVQIQIGDNPESRHDYILLMPDVNLAYSSIDLASDEFARFCDVPLKSGAVQLHLPSTAEMNALEETVKREAERTYDMEALIWATSLLTSRGRLSRNADMSTPLRLKQWPNLTRVEQFPHIMQIAAVWQQRAGTVFDVCEWLDIPQRYVIAFYNASHTLSLFAVEQAVTQSKDKAAPRKNRGLFSRLLKRLLGGGAK